MEIGLVKYIFILFINKTQKKIHINLTQYEFDVFVFSLFLDHENISRP